jgi:hypothetical protein
MTTTMPVGQRTRAVVEDFLAFLQTGEVPAGLFASDAFADLSLPTWRVQAQGVDDLIALRRVGHPALGRVPRYRLDATPTGFVLEWEETWVDGGQQWYCREMCRADVSEAGITNLSIYCTGDWDEARVAAHRASVRLVAP